MTAKTMLTIQDLAARWGVTLRQAKAAAIQGGVPMIRLKPTRHHISWATTRFDPGDVEAWEAERRRAVAAEARPAPEPAKIKPLGRRPAVPNHLGRW